jgi:copper chaperone
MPAGVQQQGIDLPMEVTRMLASPATAGYRRFQMKFTVEGMTCSHCERAISKAIERLGGRAEVDLSAGTVAVDGVADEPAVRGAIEAEGYQVTGQAGAPATLGTGNGCCGSRNG